MADPRSDAQLLKASARDTESFGEFYSRHASAVVRYFVRRTACAQTAADLAAETFAEAYVSRHRFRDVGRPARAWLFKIAARQLRRFHRAEATSTKYRRRLGMEPREFSEEALGRIEALVDLAPEIERLHTALDDLPEAQRRAVWMRIGLQHSYPDLANELRCSEGAARVRVSRALAALAQAIEEKNDDQH